MDTKRESELKNLKLRNGEFCTMWKCKNLDKDYPCIICPVINDLSLMADAFHMSVDLSDEVTAKAA